MWIVLIPISTVAIIKQRQALWSNVIYDLYTIPIHVVHLDKISFVETESGSRPTINLPLLSSKRNL